MKSRVVLVSLFAMALASAGFAQVRKGCFELTGFYGYLFGGNFPAGSNALFDTRVDVDDHDAFGASFGYYLTSGNEIEARWSRSETHFVSSSSNAVFGPSGQNLADLTIDYFMGDWVYNFGHSRAVPYFTMGAGAAVLDPGQRRDIPCLGNSCVEPTSATRFTASIGGGVKIFVSHNFGFRFDGRWYETYLNSSDHCDTFGHGHGGCSSNGSNWLGNAEATGGLVFAF